MKFAVKKNVTENNSKNTRKGEIIIIQKQWIINKILKIVIKYKK